MAKKAILDVLTSTIGKYVKNLDAESLNVAVWSGKIELHSLELNIDAVNAELDRQAAEAPNLAIPFRVTGGSFRSFEVDVPWARITSRPVVLRAKGLQVFVEPYDRIANLDQLAAKVSSEQKRIQNAKANRARSIKVNDDYRMQSNALRNLANDDEGGTKGKGGSFGGRLVRRIAENIQVEIDDVHIALKGCGSAAGVVLSSLILVTTDKYGTRTFVDRTVGAKNAESSFLYKSLSIKGLGIYLDEEKGALSRPFTLSENRANPFPDKSIEHSFILAPLSFDANLRQSDHTKCIDFPKYLLSSELAQLSILLSRNQLELGRKISQTIMSSDQVAKPIFPEYRPLVRVTKSSAKEWWMYAARCVGRLNGRRAWVEFFLAFQKRRKYIPLYKRAKHAASCSWLAKLTIAERVQLDSLESDRSISIEGIMAWRNIADAQVDLEQEKHDATRKKDGRKGVMGFFGSKGKSPDNSEEESPPIVLSPEEMKELESICLEQAVDTELSKDSRLCDVKFVLGSLKINLSTHGMAPLASLFLGLVTTNFDANVDGSFNFRLKLSSVLIHDAVTANSLYRTILRNLPSPEGLTASDNSFEFKLSKSNTGNRDLALNIVAFEMVASPLLFIEVKRFFSFSQRPSAFAVSKKNPFLAQSMSGSVDLFYDADEGEQGRSAADVIEDIIMAEAEVAAGKLSSTLLAAWRDKVEDKKLFTVDCDIHAPIIIIPEDCIRHDAISLVFDLGHLRFRVGNMEIPKKVQKWSESNRIANVDTQLDPGTLLMKNLTFSISTTKQLLFSDSSEREVYRSKAVVEPMSLKLDFGIETSPGLNLPRICAFGVFPSVAMRVSPSQLSKMAAVAKKWTQVRDKLTHKVDANTNEGVSILDEEGAETKDSLTYLPQENLQDVKSMTKKTDELSSTAATATTFHITVALQKFSVYCHRDEGDGVEAHLVSVSASSSTSFDGRISNNLSMGWFWILDRLKSDLPRSQRLLAHSNLPQPAAAFAVNAEYDVFGELYKLGVFTDDYVGSKELADISAVFASPHCKVYSHDIFRKERPFEDNASVDMILDMKFTSLFVNWNPSVLKVMVRAFSESLSMFGATQSSYAIIAPATSSNTHSLGENVPPSKSQSSLILTARLEHFELSLNSARDDLPLYVFSMSGTRVSMLSSKGIDQELFADLELGDLKIVTPTIASTKTSYRALLGLAPSHSASLLSVQYFEGKRPLDSAMMSDQIDRNKCEAYATVELSPMRFVYIQAQVLTLIEYINDGILGTITAHAAASAANAAKDIVSSNKIGDKVFSITAVGFDLILPEAASSENHFVVHAADLHIRYRAFSAPGGGLAWLSLSEVSMRDSFSEGMVDKPIKLEIKADLPPDTVGSVDDQTISADMEISEASFVLSKAQYIQILRMLNCNISQVDPFLREAFADTHSVGLRSLEQSESPRRQKNEHSITHAGLVMVEKKRRIKVDLRIELLSLKICDNNLTDPLVKISAEKTRIHARLLPDQDQLKSEIILHNLICEDVRLKSTNRQFKDLISQTCHGEQNKESSDVFVVSWAKDNRQNMTDISLKVGSPRIVFVPDTIAGILRFLKSEDSGRRDRQTRGRVDELTSEGIEVDFDKHGDAIETSFVEEKEKLSLSLVTGDCSIVLVDMGSSALSEVVVTRALNEKGYKTQATESIVLQGSFTANVKTETEVNSGKIERVDLDLHGNRAEVYNAYGRELSSPLQIVEPTSYAVFFTIHPKSGKATEVELRGAALEPLDITFSMQNAALFTAIFSSIKGSLVQSQSLQAEDVKVVPLSERETNRIENLAFALESADTMGSEEHSVSESRLENDESSHSSKHNGNETDLSSSKWKLRLTLPETNIAFVNDLQGLDDALFRISFSNLVTGAEGSRGLLKGVPQMTYDCHMNTALSADYFDSSVNIWKKLLKKPWEMTVKSSRGVSKRFFRSSRLSTTFDIESFPCHISFSEQFLVSLNAANRMWSIYSRAISLAPGVDVACGGEVDNAVTKEALAANAARNLVVSLPYAVENHCGIDAFFVCTESGSGKTERKPCPTGTIQFFRFDAPCGGGYGGRRLYGQDVLQLKSLTVYVGNATIDVVHMDSEIGHKRRAHDVGDGLFLISHVTRDGKSTVLHLSSHVDIYNNTSIPFDISVKIGIEWFYVGTCGENEADSTLRSSNRSSILLADRGVTRKTKRFGIPLHLLDSIRRESADGTIQTRPCLQVSPRIPASQRQLGPLVGEFNIPSCHSILSCGNTDQAPTIFDVTCRTDMSAINADSSEGAPDPFVLQVRMKVEVISENYPFIEIFLKPRATIQNMIPVSLSLKTPMPYTYLFSQDKTCLPRENSSRGGWQDEVRHEIPPSDGIEIFTPGASIAICIKCSDHPVGGGVTGWMKGDWVDLPMVPEFRLPEPLRCLFPFETSQRAGVEGSEFFIIEAGDDLSESALEKIAMLQGGSTAEYIPKRNKADEPPASLKASIDVMRSYHVTVCNYGVDHTGGILFEQILISERQLRGSQSLDRRSISVPTLTPFSAFSSTMKQARISLLPGSSVPLRILHLTMDGQDGLRRSLPFRIEDVSICEGGIESTSLQWEDSTSSGFFAYRRLVGTESYQSEIHVIPEFIVYNGSKAWSVLIRQQGGHGPTTEIFLEPGKTAPVRRLGKSGLVLSFLYVEFGGVTPWMRMDDLSHKVVIIRSMDNLPIGSLACQTVMGSRDSKLVVKLGDVQLGDSSRAMTDKVSLPSDPFVDDFLRIRVRWSELRVTLNEANPFTEAQGNGSAIMESVLDRILAKKERAQRGLQFSRKGGSSSSEGTWVDARANILRASEEEAAENSSQAPVCTVVLHRFTVDWQKVFNDENASMGSKSPSLSPERSQLSMIIHHVKVLDETPLTPFPTVFDSTSSISFLDFCVRFRGPLNADLVKVDLVDLNLAHANGVSERMFVKTSEDFVWKMLDVVNRIIVATAELAGVDIRLEWDEQEGEYIVAMDTIADEDTFEESRATYTPPKSDKLFDVKKARISPFKIIVSFKRQPHVKRYKRLRDVRGARIMNYFTTKLKFTLDKAELSFSQYESSNLKGPADKLLEILAAVYMARVKLKFVTILSAVSFQDWKSLASRKNGDDDFQDGDIARVTGNLAGKSADMVFNKLGKGLGEGLSSITSKLGDEIENSSGKVGAKSFGAGVNSVVTGIGDGVGDTLKGVGSGTGKVLKGAGQGIGHVFGGVTGAVLLAGKGIGKGVSKGDGKAVISGFTDAGKSIGNGFGQGVNSTVTGAADGVLSAGQGLVSGVKNIGKGFGSAFLGSKKSAKK